MKKVHDKEDIIKELEYMVERCSIIADKEESIKDYWKGREKTYSDILEVVRKSVSCSYSEILEV